MITRLQRRWLRILGGVIAISLVVCLPLRTLLADRGVKVGVYQNAPGVFTSPDGQTQGFYIDILNDIAKDAHWQLNFVPGTWSEGLQRLGSGQLDILVGMAFSVERAERYTFTHESVFSNWGQLYVRNSDIQSILDLKNRTIAGLKGDIYTIEFKKLLDDFGVFYQFIETKEYEEAMAMVAAGKADAAIISRSNGLRIENRFELHRSEVICCATNIRFALTKQTDPDLLKTLDHHLMLLKRDKNSFYYEMFNKWFGRTSTPHPSWLKPTIAAFVVAILLIWLLVSYAQLRRRMRDKEQQVQEEMARRKRAEFRLHIVNQALDHTTEAVVITDETFQIIDINPAYESLTGYTKQAALGRKAFRTMDGIRQRENDKTMWAALNKTGLWKGVLQEIRADGSSYSQQITVTTCRDGAGAITHCIGIFSTVEST